jgi:WD40 repeat protein/tetratricopeptide (TPR) repeat protein
MERETARRIVDRLQGEVGDRMSIEPYFWEHEVMVATKDYQENIPEMDGFDIVICMLWSRLGTPLHPNRHPRPGGGFFESGTEYEFFTAMQAHNMRGTPDIFVFRNATEPRRPSRPKEAREQVDREIDRLDHFFEKYFQEEKYFTSAINVYSTLGEFEEKLNLALRSFLEGRFPLINAKKAPKASYQGQPYLGLSAFDFKDAPVFFGRTAQVGEVVEAFQVQELEAQANGGQEKHFVLILGSSGSGKSSLARAGVLPMLVQPGVVEGALSWRRAIFKPGDAGTDPFLAFAASLLAPEALPELASAGTTAAEIAAMLRSPGNGAEILMRQAFAQAAAIARTEEEHRLQENIRRFEQEAREEDAKALRQKLAELTPPAVRLAVLADQLEELFTSGMAEDTVALFIDKLAALASSGRVFVLGTLRSDFYPECLKHPRLVELMRDSGTYPLPAPTAGDIGQMIRQPAAAAGLSFEENRGTGENLDDLLRDAAIKDPAALPLLSYTLEQLYERRSPEGLLTLAAYHDLGGLEGAIGRRAESVFTALTEEAKAAFDQVWRQLVTLSDGSQPVRRRAEFSALTASPGAPQLVDALVAARLLTVDQQPDGERTVSVAHEALLRHWPRVVDWARENLDFLRARARMAARLSEWREHDSSDHYLIPPGPPLAEAESILAHHAASLDPSEIDFVTRSSTLARRGEQSRLRRARLVATGALVLSALAVTGGAYAFVQKKNADRERIAAVRQKDIAEEATSTARESQARTAYILGNENLGSGKTREGLASLAHALAIDPQHKGVIDRLYSHHLYGLPKAIPILSATGPEAVRQRISGATNGPVQRILYLTEQGKPEVYDLNTKKVIPGTWNTEPDSTAAVVMEDGTLVLNIRKNMEAHFWQVLDDDSTNSFPATKLPADFTTLTCCRDGRHFLFATPDGKAHVYSIKDGKRSGEWQQKGKNLSFHETMDGSMLSASGEDLVRYDFETKKITSTRVDPEHLILSVQACREDNVAVILREKKLAEGEFTRSGDIIFVDAGTLETIPNSREYHWTGYPPDFRPSSYGDSVVVASNQHAVKLVHQMDPAKDLSFDLPVIPVYARLSPDERLIVCNTPDGTVRIFDTKTKALAFEPISHDGTIEDLDISWDGRYLLTSTGRRALVWDLSVGPALSLPVVVDQEIRSSAISPDGHLITGHPGGIRRWDLKDLREIGKATHVESTGLDCLMDATGTRAVQFFDNTKLRFIRTGETDIASSPVWNSPSPVSFWGFSQDGSRFYASDGEFIRLLDTSTCKVIGEPLKVPGAFQNVFFIPGSNDLVIVHGANRNGSPYFTIKLRSADNTGDIPFNLPDANVQYLALDKQGRWMLAGCSSIGTVGAITEFYALLWDLENPDTPPRKFIHPGVISALEFSDDGSLFAIGGMDQTVKIWSTGDKNPSNNELMIPGGYISMMKFNPDSTRLATISVKDNRSSVRVWDWREGCAINQPLDYPVVADQVRFIDHGKKLLVVRPTSQGSVERQLQVNEVSPPDDLNVDFKTLTQAVIAQEVDEDGQTQRTDPFGQWNLARASSPDSWFFKPPAKRSISPALSADSGRWMLEETSVTIDELSSAMPAVGLCRAAIAYWYQLNLIRRENELKELEAESSEYEAKNRAIEDLRRQIQTLVEFGRRNAPGDAAVCYYLSMWARSAGEKADAIEFIQQALTLEPDNLNYLNQAALVHLDQNDLKEERKTLEHILQLKPGDPLNQIRLGYNLWRTGERPKAKELFTASIDWPDISIHDKAAIYSHLGRKEEALTVYQKIADDLKEASQDKQYNTDACVYLILGNFQAGKKDVAIEYFQQLLKHAPAANDPDVIDGSNLAIETKEVLKKVLALTVARHRELAPGTEEQ